MAVTDTKIHKDAKVAWDWVTFEIGSTAVSQTDLEIDEFLPGYAFEIMAAQVFATAVTATASVDVLIGSTTALTGDITPVAAAATAGTLATDIAARRGTSTERIRVTYTTNGTGAITKGKVRVAIRPVPLNGEAFSS